VQTLKTAVVVVLLLFVIYGGFVALNGTNTTLNPELENLVDLDTTTPDISGVTGPFTATNSAPSTTAATGDPWAAFNTAPSAGFNSSPAPAAAIPEAASVRCCGWNRNLSDHSDFGYSPNTEPWIIDSFSSRTTCYNTFAFRCTGTSKFNKFASVAAASQRDQRAKQQFISRFWDRST
jgi:hypothetical protein